MHIVYCRACKAIIGAGDVALPASHKVGDDVHGDAGTIEVADSEWMHDGETVDQFTARLSETYGGQFT